MEHAPVIKMDMYIPGDRILGQAMLHEETMKRIAGEAVEKAFTELSTGNGGEEYNEFVSSVAGYARTVIEDVTRKAVDKIIYERYAKDIDSIVRGIGAEIMLDFTENLRSDISQRLKQEFDFYKESRK